MSLNLSSSRPLRSLVFALTLVAPLAAHAADAPQLQLAPSAADDPVVAKINSAEIHKSDLVAAQKQLPQQYQQVPLEAIFPQLLDQVVNNKLLMDAAKDAKLNDDPEVKDRMAKLQDHVVEQVYIDRLLTKATSDDALKARYQKSIKDAPAQEEIHGRQILLKDEAEAKAVIAQLDKGGDFVKLANEKNPSKDSNGGDLGYFTREQMVPEFSEVAFKLGKGQLSDPVKTQFGWHVLKVEDKRMREPPPFDKVRGEIEQFASRKAQVDLVAKLRADAKIERLDKPAEPKK